MNQIHNETDELRPQTRLSIICQKPWAGLVNLSLGAAVFFTGLACLEPFLGLMWADLFNLATAACLILMAALFLIALAIWLVGKFAGYKVSLRPDRRYQAISSTLLVLGILLMGFPMYASGWIKAREAASQAEKPAWQRIRIGQSQATIELPSNYRPVDDVVDPSSGIAVSHPSAAVSILATATPLENVSIASIEELADKLTQNLVLDEPDAEVIHRSSSRFRDFESVMQRVGYVSEGKAVHEQINLHRVGNHWIQIHLFGTPSLFKAHWSQLDGIIHSLKRINHE